MLKRSISLALVFLAAAAPADAHPAAGETVSFLAGFSHPFFGLDHIVVMIAVGLWAATVGGRAIWIVPASFVAAMALGFGIALNAVSLPLVEPMILASVVALGLLVAAAVRLPASVGAVLVGVFAVFHGYAHGEEIGIGAALPFGLGFAASTAILHVTGVGIGVSLGSGAWLGEARGKIVSRSLGALTAGVGLILAFG